MSKKNLKLGLFGFGCVGQGLYSVLNQTKGIRASVEKFVSNIPRNRAASMLIILPLLPMTFWTIPKLMLL